MQLTPRPLFLTIVLVAVALNGTGCSPQAKKARFLQLADNYYAAGDYDKAEVEYFNALKIDPQNGHAIGNLGIIYSTQGRTTRGIAFIVKGHELLPDDLDLRLKVGQLYQATGKLEDARKEADFILTRKPQDPEAPLLWVATMTNPKDADMLRKRLLDLPAPAPTSAPVLVALASLELRLAHVPEAEALLQKAKAADEKFAPVYSVLAATELAKKNIPQATQYFQQAAALSPPRSPRILQYAQFKTRSGDMAEGKRLLLDITKKTPDFVPAWVALAEIGVLENNLNESAEMIAKALARDPQNIEALVMQGRVSNLKGEYDKSISVLEKLAENFPRMAVVHQELGRAYASTGDINKAITSLTQAVTLAPNLPEATLMLARLDFQKGETTAAANLLRKLLAQMPELAPAQLLLADIFRAQNNLDGALAIYQQLEKQAPQNAQNTLLRGLVLAQQGKDAEARTAYERAFSLSPDSPTALEQLVNLHLKDKSYRAAAERVEAEIAKNPKLAGFGQLLLAKIDLAQDDKTQAEVHLKKAIELMPDSPAAYYLLAGIYSRTNQQAKALAQLNEILARDPKQSTALMMASLMQDQQGNHAAAREGYEKMLALNPRSAVALNNLAYLYSEKLGDLDKALDLAQKARQSMPNDAHSADTLGWVLYKKRQYTRALSLINEAAEKRPTDAEIQYHLGLIYYDMGADKTARTALQRALELDPDAKWKAAAQQALNVLQIDINRSDARSMLEKALAQRSDDQVALARLAALDEREGKTDQAIKALETATKANPSNVEALISLARLHGMAKHSDQALEYAKAARKLAPDDAEVTQFLGRLAYQNNDFPWAFSLLQEAARRQENSPELLYDLAWASYSVGRVGDAEAAMNSLLNLAKAPNLTVVSHAEEARQFLTLVSLAANPAEAAKQSAVIDQVLKADPSSVPGLMAAAAMNEQSNAIDAARQNYEKVLARFPDFSPAKLRLAILGGSLTAFDQKTYDRALQARTIYPTDAMLARTLGIQTYLKGDHTRALALLKESSASREDPITLYYLGLAQSQLKDANAAKNLRRAVELGLKGDALAEARKILAESK
ncbi:MAG TPA: tetratricopeptide repeat protein [Lacunisphaera sp.]|nr:tetratricopeptide repeat protein [Lacunisphaera sp.]